MFHISSSGIVDGRMDRRFGKFSSEHKDTVPTLSLPVSWSCVPEGIKSLALVMQDYDAVPVC